MSVGPVNAPSDQYTAGYIMTRQTQAAAVGAADILLSAVFNCNFCRRIYCNGAGTLFVQRDGDQAPVAYTVVAGTIIDGRITLIGGTTNHGTATNGLSLVLEV